MAAEDGESEDWGWVWIWVLALLRRACDAPGATYNALGPGAIAQAGAPVRMLSARPSSPYPPYTYSGPVVPPSHPWFPVGDGGITPTLAQTLSTLFPSSPTPLGYGGAVRPRHRLQPRPQEVHAGAALAHGGSRGLAHYRRAGGSACREGGKRRSGGGGLQQEEGGTGG